MTKAAYIWELREKREAYFAENKPLTCAELNRGDTVVCLGLGYPHWEGEEFEVGVIFDDETISIKGCLRVSVSDFVKKQTT